MDPESAARAEHAGTPPPITGAELRARDAARALERSEARFRELTAALPQLIWTAAPDGELDYLSDQWAEYVGIDPRSLQGWDWQRIVHPEDLP